MKIQYKDNDSTYEVVDKNQINIMDLYTLVEGNTTTLEEVLKQIDGKLNAPIKEGTTGQVLMIDGTGNVVWGDTGATIDPKRIFSSGSEGRRTLDSIDDTASVELYAEDATGDSAGSGTKYRASNNIIFDVVNERKAGAVMQVDDTAEGTTKRVIVKDIPMKKEITIQELIDRKFTVEDLGKKMTCIYAQSNIEFDFTAHIESKQIGNGIILRPSVNITESNAGFDAGLMITKEFIIVTVKTGVAVTVKKITETIYKTSTKDTTGYPNLAGGLIIQDIPANTYKFYINE